MSEALIAKLRAARERWLELAPGKRVCIRRPGEVSLAKLGGRIDVEQLCGNVVAWDGITEADLFPGASEVSVPFDAALWAEVIVDRADWAGKVASETVTMVTEHVGKREAISGN